MILINEVYCSQSFFTKNGKFFYKKMHVECVINDLREKAAEAFKNKRLYGGVKRPKVAKDKQTYHYKGKVEDDVLQRRQRLLQYLNRDRWKLEGYYTRGDLHHIARSYEKISKRISELVELGMEFKINELGVLIREHDDRLYGDFVSTSNWGSRNKALLARAKEIRSVIE